MTHFIFGTGLIGGYLAGCFAAQKLDTRLIGRPQSQQKLNAGITVSDLQGHKAESPPPTFWNGESNSSVDFLWVTVKCTAVENAIDDLKELIQADTVIITCQNGFGSDQIIRNTFPDNTVLSATVGFNVAEPSSGHYHRSTDGKLVVESHAITDKQLKLAHCDLLPIHITANIEAERWAKLQLNLANPVNALADIPTKAMTEDPGYRRVIATLMKELLSVTRAMNLSLPKLTAAPAKALPHLMRLPNLIYLKIAQKTLAIDPTARTSMWWDLSNGRLTEIDYLNQAVVEQGEKLGIDCPANRKIVELVHAVERGDASIGMSAQALQKALSL